MILREKHQLAKAKYFQNYKQLWESKYLSIFSVQSLETIISNEMEILFSQ